MKTRPENILEGSNQKVVRDVLRLLPPQSHKLSTFRGSELSRDFKKIVSSYTPSLVSSSLQIFRDEFITLPYRQSLYGEFLVHSKTFHTQEPLGTLLFSFKQFDGECSSVDIIFSPVSLYRVCGLDARQAPHTHRIGNIWYETDADFQQAVPNIQALIQNCTLHRYLTPVGPLVQNIHSTFLNKLSTVVKGEVLSKKSPPENLKLKVPADLFFDLDDSPSETRAGNQPVSLRVTYYACIVYLLMDNTPSASIMIFRSGKGFSDVMFQLKHFYSDTFIHKVRVLGDELDINNLTLGAVCALGYSSAQTIPTRGNIQFRSFSLPTVEISDFVSLPGTWSVL
ncbi:capsid triplex subunit 1 [Rhinolophus gammaherpesvirus 1]|uniref:Capsid triplex subunit 1 n=1 Tax=Rhinolophus gammaherpesvirus 1 TaxID=2054179 RepID=A0A2Z5U6E4_9GAMA|nr:capsid triplex subunit 1 [Rhinolophus gammaherpesvirus 1]BBB06515.1 capsid triplex subunit 1 [Rhinolophus gammaherpesvirus 1]